MTKTELLEIIANGENSGIEFKRDTLENYKLAKELVAFANLAGGRVLLGVEDDGNITGISRSNLEEWVMTTCRDKIRPELIPYYELVKDVEPGKHIAVVKVGRGWSVHHVLHNHHRSYYIRVGTIVREASGEELERLFQQRGGFRLETRAVSGSSISDLDRRRLRDYFERIREQEIPSEDDEIGWHDLLVNTEFLVVEDETTSASVAGLLLFGSNPNRFLPQSGIDAVAYPGGDKDYNAKERSALRGPMTPLFSVKNKGASRADIVENGLVEQALEFIRRNTEVVTHLENGARRKERRSYPQEAIREAMVNALVHRDYLLSGTDIELSIFEVW